MGKRASLIILFFIFYVSDIFGEDIIAYQNPHGGVLMQRGHSIPVKATNSNEDEFKPKGAVNNLGAPVIGVHIIRWDSECGVTGELCRLNKFFTIQNKTSQENCFQTEFEELNKSKRSASYSRNIRTQINNCFKKLRRVMPLHEMQGLLSPSFFTHEAE